MSCVVEVVDSVDTDGQSVEKNPSTNQVKKVVTYILIHWNPVHICIGEREEGEGESGRERERERKREREREREREMNNFRYKTIDNEHAFVKKRVVFLALEYCGRAEAVYNLKRYKNLGSTDHTH